MGSSGSAHAAEQDGLGLGTRPALVEVTSRLAAQMADLSSAITTPWHDQMAELSTSITAGLAAQTNSAFAGVVDPWREQFAQLSAALTSPLAAQMVERAAAAMSMTDGDLRHFRDSDGVDGPFPTALFADVVAVWVFLTLVGLYLRYPNRFEVGVTLVGLAGWALYVRERIRRQGDSD